MVLIVILAMGGLSFAPSFKIGDLTSEKIDILSDLREKSEANEEEEPVDFTANFKALDQELAEAAAEPADSVQSVAPVRYKWIVEADSKPKRAKFVSDNVKPASSNHQMPIEDFDTTGSSNLDKFIKKLIDGNDVRVAFLGDSFIEGDIITVDMREQLQSVFGGRGVGFVPAALPFEIYRPSVRRQASGWTAYSLLNQSSVPAAYKDRFFMSGYLAAGGRGASVRWQTSNTKPHLNPCSRARIFVSSQNTSSVELTVNDTLKHKIDIAGASYVRELYVEAPISSIKMQVLSGNILCHGASLEGGHGIMVDNLSIRGNSGYTIFSSSIATNTQIDKVMGYDLIVLEYGLNAMQPGQRNFTKYQQKLGEMIRYCKRCFPNAAILVLGVSDRAIKGEGGWHSINSVTYLGPAQRKAAKDNGACFWDLGKVVMSYGGIKGFVKNGWAAGDHIHINFKGGARIAESLAQAIQQRAYEMLLRREGKYVDSSLPFEFEPWKTYVDGSSEENLLFGTTNSHENGGDALTEQALTEGDNYQRDYSRSNGTTKSEEAAAEAPKAEVAKQEEAKPEQPIREENQAREATTETVEAVAAEKPATPAPAATTEEVAEAPAVKKPATEANNEKPAVNEVIKTEEPTTEVIKAEEPKVEVAATEEVKAEAPKAEEPKAQELTTERAKIEGPKTEVSAPKTSNIETKQE